MRRERKKRNKLIIGLVSVLFLMTVAYAAFQTNLDITGTGNIDSRWDISITNVTSGTPTGNAENATSPTWSALTALMQANLRDSGDAMEYTVTITNNGTLDAKLESITKDIKSNNDAIKITYSGYTKGERLNAGSSKDITVRIAYDSSYTGEVDYNQTTEVGITFNYVQGEGGTNTPTPAPTTYLVTYNCTENGGKSCSDNDEYIKADTNIDLTKKADDLEDKIFLGWNTDKDATSAMQTISPISENTTLYAIYTTTPLMMTWASGSASDFHSSTYKSAIKSAQVVDLDTTSLSVPEIDNETCWDVSANSNGSVRAWVVEDANDNTKYNLYIGGRQRVVAQSLTYMFYNFTSLTSVNFDKLDTTNTTSMGRMFRGCTSLTDFDLGNMNLPNLTTMLYMFYGCSNLTSVDFSGLKTPKLKTMTYVFYNCKKLTDPSFLKDLDTKNVTTMGNMFYGCSGLTNLDFLKKVNTSSLATASNMFYNCTGLTDISALAQIDTKNLTTMGTMFRGCTGLTNIDVIKQMDTTSLATMSSTFYGCTGLVNVNLSGWDIPKVTTVSQIFYNCTNLEAINLSNIISPKLETMSQIFYNCTSLNTVNFNNFNTSAATTFASMFNGCTGLTELNLSSFNTTNVTDMSSMFRNCSNLKTIYVSTNFVITNVTSYSTMFTGCTLIVGGCGTTYNSSYVTYNRAYIDSADQPGYFTDINQSIFSDSISTNVTTNSISVTINAHSKNSDYDLIKYEFSIDGGTTWIESLDGSNNPNNTYKYDDLINNTTYKILIRVTNENSESWMFGTGNVTTTTFSVPTFTEATVNNQNAVSIAYPSGCTGDFTCSYILNDGSPVNVSNSPTIVTYSSNGTIVASVTDGYNILNSTYTLFTDPIMQEWSYNAATDFHDSTYKTNITSVDVVDLNETSMPSGATNWDVSANGSGSVTAWVIDDPNNTGKYKLYIGGNGGVYANPNASYLFRGFTSLQTANLSKLNTVKATSMSQMFYECSNLSTLDISNFDTSKVTNMSGMFYKCLGLTTLDLSHFDTSNVTYMSEMFCSSYGVYMGLTSLNLSGWDTSKVTSMSCLFYGCRYLTTLNVSHFDTSNVTDMYCMFYWCQNLTTIDVSNFDTSKVTSMEAMFLQCNNVTTLDVSHFDTSKVTTMLRMFNGCSNVTTLNVSGWDTSKVTNMAEMFISCGKLTTVDVSHFNTSNVTDMSYMFCQCSVLPSINLSNFDTSKVTNMTWMFANDPVLSNLNVSSFDTSSVTNMSYMFQSYSGTTLVGVDNFDTSRVTTMYNMFRSCINITSIDLSNFDTSKVTNMAEMFCYCTNLTTIYASETFKISQVTSSSDMFTNDTLLIGGNGTVYNSSYRDKTYARVDKSGQLGYFTEGKRPIISNISTTTTADTITAIVTASIPKAGISITKYEFSIDDGAWIDNNTSNIYTFSNLTENQNYRIKVRVTGSNNETSTKEIIVKGATKIDVPAYSESLSAVTITYPTGCGSTYTCTYSKNGGSSVTVTTNTVDVEFTDSGTLVATVTDGTLVASSSYTFIPKSMMKSWDYWASADFHSSTYKSKITSVDIVDLATTTLTVPEINNSTCWDVSVDSNGGVKAWVINDPENSGKYKLYIGGKGGVVANPNSSNIFVNFTGLKTANMEKLNTSKVTNMYRMFYYCYYLTGLDLSSWNTSNVTNMSNMFYYCNALTSLNLNNFNTSNVTDMSSMFNGCTSLTTLDVSPFDTSKVTNMGSMFYNCYRVNSLNVSGFNTSNVTDMSSMFSACNALTTLDLSNFDTSKVTTMAGMFGGYSDKQLSSLNISNFDTSNVTNMSNMFSYCSNFTSINLSHFNTSKVVDMSYMFSGCKNLSSLNISNFDTSHVTNMRQMFNNCYVLTNVDLSHFDTSHVTNMSWMFATGNEIYPMTQTTWDLSSFDTSKVTDMSYMFYGSKNLTTVNISNFDTSNTDNMSYMFYGCNSLLSIDLGGFNTSKTTNMSNMFKNCTSLVTIYASDNFVTNKVISHNEMFYACTSLVGGNGTTYSQLHMDKSYARLDVSGNPGYFTDRTRPTISNISTSATVNSITTVVTASVPTGDTITNYEYSIDNGENWVTSNSNTYTFNDLDSNTTYKITVKVNGVKSNTLTVTTKAKGLQVPNISQEDDTITITYPEGCGDDYTCEYKKSTDVDFTASSKNIVSLETNGYENYAIIAKISDGTSEISRSYTVTINSVMRAWANGATDDFHNSTYKANITSVDIVDLNSTSAPGEVNNTTIWDVSAKGNNSVIAWVIDDPNNIGKYKLYIGGNGEVIAQSLSYMFHSFTSLASVNLDKLNVTNTTTMNRMFYGCSSLPSVDLSNMNFPNLTTMTYAFYGCTSLTTVDFDQIKVPQLNTLTYTFYGCTSLTNLNFLKKLNTSNVTTMGTMFYNCTGLTDISAIAQIDTSAVTTIGSMFYGCTSLTNIDVIKQMDVTSLATVSSTFYGCSGLVNVNLSGWNIPEVTTIGSMFYNCTGLKTINLSNIISPKLKTMSSVFRGCTSLDTINFTNFDSSTITTFNSIFYGCTSLIELDLSGFVTTSLTNTGSMFYNCSNLTTIYASNNFVITQITSHSNMFRGCTSLVGGCGTTHGTSTTTSYNNKTRAVIDTVNTVGYFTDINQAIRIKTMTTTPSTQTITVSVTAEKLNSNSEITGYAFKLEGGEYVSSVNPTYKFTDLTPNTSYTVYAKAINANGDYIERKATATTATLTTPTFSEANTNNGKTITITYQAACSTSDLVCTYIKDDGTPVEVTTNTVNVEFTSAGTLVATATESASSVSSSYIVSMAPMMKSWSSSATTDFHNSTYKTNITSVDIVDLNSTSMPNGATNWDVSQAGDGSVKAWVINDPNNSGKYKLYIGGKGGVLANKNSSYLFYNFTGLTNVNLSLLYTANVTNMSYMFSRCTSITSLDLSNFDTSEVTSMYMMFAGYTGSPYTNMSLSSINLTGWDTSKVTDMSYMFYRCSGLTTLNVNHFRTLNVTTMYYMFYNCYSLTNLNLNSWNTSKVTNMGYMFQSCNKLTALDLSSFDTSNVIYMNYMFYSCSGLTTLDVSNFNTAKVTTMESMFYYCSKLEALDVNNFNTSNVTNMYQMFRDCGQLTTLDVSNFDTSKVTNMSRMFYYCQNLTTIYASNSFVTTGATNSSEMFYYCPKLVGGNGTSYNYSYVDKTYAVIDAVGTPGYFTEGSNNPVVITYISTIKTTNSITVAVKARSKTSDVVNYQFSIDDGETWINSGTNTYAFTNLVKDTTYPLIVKIIDGDNHILEYTKLVTTTNIATPTYSETRTGAGKKITITYQEECGKNGLVCTYIKDSGTPVEVNTNTVDVEFTSAGTLVATATDGAQTSSSSYTITMSSMMKSWSSGASTDFHNSTYKSNITSVDIVDLSNTGLSVPTIDEVTCWDVSAEGNGDVKAWVVNDPNNSGKYKLYIGGNGGVVANPNSSYLFYYFTGLTTSNITLLDVTNVTDMSYMFYNCSSLTELDVSDWNTSNVTTMQGIFNNCSSLTELDVSDWDTSQVTNMSNMFSGCQNLSTLDVSNFDTSKSTSMSSMFYNCSKLTTLDVSHWDTSKDTYMSQMFYNCSGLTSIDVSHFNTSKVVYMTQMFYNCDSLTSIDVSHFDTSSVQWIYGMFDGCRNAVTINASDFDISGVTNLSRMFYRCNSLEALNLSKWNTSNVTTLSETFSGCTKLTSLDISSWDTQNVTDMYYMFYQCYELVTLDLSSFDTSNVTNMNNMFNVCQKLVTIYVSDKFVTTNVTNSYIMFGSCTSLVGGNGTTYNSSYADKTYAVIDAPGTPGYFTEASSSPIVVTYVSMVKTTNSITVAAKAHSKTSEVINYQFSIDDGETWINSGTNTYRFTNLEKNTEYPITVKITDGDNHSTEYTKVVRTLNTAVPTYYETRTDTGKRVTITYQEECGKNGLVCTYIKDNGTPVQVTKNTVNVEFTSSGTLVATVTGDNSSVSSSYTVSMQSMMKYWSSGASTDFHNSTYKNNITSVDIVDLSNTGLSVPAIDNSTCWDVSAEGNGDVKAWVINDPNNSGKYKLYIGGNGGVVANPNSSYLFYSFNGLTSANLDLLNTSNVANMSNMFSYCSSLTSLNISNFNTSNVTSMYYMFTSCSSLSTLNLSNWNTTNVINMYYMFAYCSNLSTLNLNNWNTMNTTSMGYMFYSCNSLTSLNISNFNTMNVTNMYYMFGYCRSLTSLNLSHFNTSKVTDMSGMFYQCYNLTTLNLSNFNTSKVTTMNSMFSSCYYLPTLDLSSFDTSNVINMGSMFSSCYYLATLNLSSFNTSNVTTMESMFQNCSDLTDLNLSSFSTSKATTMESMFQNCSDLINLNLSNFNTSNVTTMKNMFQNCYDLIDLNLSSFNTSKVTDMSQMFYSCYHLPSLDVSHFNTSNVTTMTDMFRSCSYLEILDISNFNTSKVTDMSNMFNYCYNLEVIYVSDNFVISQVTSSSYMFNYCPKLVGGNGTTYNSSYTDKTYAVIDAPGTPGYFTESTNSLIITYVSMAKTTNSITVTAKAHSTTSEVINYRFSIDNGETWINSGANTYRFTDLEKNTEYPITVRIIDGDNHSTEYTKVVRTLNTAVPTYYETRTDAGKKVTIAYQEECGKNGLVCTYIKDSGTLVEVTTNTVDVEFTSSGTLVATVTGDNSSVSSSYTVNMQSLMKSWSSGASTDFHNSTYKNNITSVDIVDLSNTQLSIPAIDNSTCWDVSAEGNGDVKAWVINDPNNSGKYKLYIGGNGGVVANPNSSYLFYNFTGLTSANLDLLNTSNVANMSNMFSYCSSLTSLNISNINTSNVTDMSAIFGGCSQLTTLDLSHFNTSNVTSMGAMFQNCTGLTSLNLSNWNTGNVTTMGMMFYSCTGLTSLNLSNFNTSNVTNMSFMFYACQNLTTLDLSNFDTSKVTDMSYMFYGGYDYYSGAMKLVSLNISNFNTSKVTNMSGMFYQCHDLINIDVSNFDTSKVTTMQGMFGGCISVSALDVSNFDTREVTDMNEMFYHCDSLTVLDLSNFDTRKVTTTYRMFEACFNLVTIYVSDNFVTTNVTQSSNMFWVASSVVGGNGTTYNSSYYDKTYARIDAPGTPGYFTDGTKATISSVATTATSNSITTVVTATAPSGDTITSYGYSIDNGANWVASNSNTYTFTGLNSNTTYKIKVKVNSTKSNTVSVTAKTRGVQLPKFTKSGRNVIITYPSGCGSTYTCQYKKSTDTSFTTAVNKIVSLTFDEEGNYTLIATIADGVTTVNSTYTFNIVTPASETLTASANIVTSGDGLYNNGDGSYTYKGASPSNYIRFNNETWRIMSIDSIGIKIIKDTKLSTSRAFDTENYRSTSNNSYCTYPPSGCDAWAATSNLVGQPATFSNGRVSGTVNTDSSLNSYLNGDYYTNTLGANTNIIKGIFNVGPKDNESAYKWKGYIGLATESEYVAAGESNSYLNNNASWWLITVQPNSTYSERVRIVDFDGSHSGSSYPRYTNIGIRPVLYLDPNIGLTGAGTNDANIYQIVS